MAVSTNPAARGEMPLAERRTAAAVLEILKANAQTPFEELEALLERVPGIYVVAHDPECRRITGSRYAHRFFGLPERTNLSATAPADEAPTGYSFRTPAGERIAPEDLPVQRAARGEEVDGCELAVHRADGSVSYLLGSAVPLRRADGSVRGAMGKFIDITALRNATRALDRERDLLRRIIDTIPVMVTVYDPALQEFDANPAWCETTGWSREDAARPDLLEKVYPDPAERERARRFMQSLESGWRDFVMTAKDGSPVESTWANIVLPDGTRVGVGIDIRERKRAEEALRRSEERFRVAFAHAPVGMVLLNLDGEFVHANRAFCQLLGYSEEELQVPGFDFRRLTHPDDLPASVEGRRRLLSGEIPALYLDKRYVRKDGRIVWARVSVALLHDEAGEPAHTVALLEDLEERRQAEAVRRREQEFRTLAEHSPDMICRLDRELRWQYANPAVEAMLGRSREELLGLSMAEAGFAPEVLAFWHREVDAAFDTGERRTTEFVCSHSGGEVREFEWHLVPEEGPEGGVETVLVVARDISARKRAEAALSASEASLADAQRIARLGSWEWVIAGDSLRCSEQMFRIFGLEPNAGPTRYSDFLERVHPQDREALRAAVEAAVRQRAPLHLEYRVVRPDGTIRTVEGQGEVVADAEGRPWKLSGTLLDISERKQAEDALHLLTSMLHEQNRQLEERAAGVDRAWVKQVSAVLEAADGCCRWLEDEEQEHFSELGREQLQALRERLRRVEAMLDDLGLNG